MSGAEATLAEKPRRLSNRTRLTLFLVPIGLVFAGAQVARAIWPTLLTEAPWTLLVLSSNTTRMLLVEPLVPATVFFTLAIGRVVLLAPVYYGFGRNYGESALRWAERKLGPSSAIVPKTEKYFRRFSHPLVAWSPHLFVSVMAGATGMKARVFFPVAAAGTVAKVTAVYFLGDALAAPLEDFADFVGRYQWYLTPITFAIVAVQLVRRRRKDQIPIESVDEFEEELEEIEEELEEERGAETLNPPSTTQG
jgi:membrane protein DedA with SNARE-associated domain